MAGPYFIIIITGAGTNNDDGSDLFTPMAPRRVNELIAIARLLHTDRFATDRCHFCLVQLPGVAPYLTWIFRTFGAGLSCA